MLGRLWDQGSADFCLKNHARWRRKRTKNRREPPFGIAIWEFGSKAMSFNWKQGYWTCPRVKRELGKELGYVNRLVAVMYGALGAGCTAPQAKNELTLEMASFPFSSPVTSHYSSRLSGCSSPATPTIFSEFRQIRVYLEHRGGAHGLRPQLSSPPSGCAVCPVSQLSISSCLNPRPKWFLPCLLTVAFSSSR